MKNPHGVEPTIYKKRKESKYAIRCNSRCGPIFGNYNDNNSFFCYYDCSDIYIGDNCNEENSCCIEKNNERGYEDDPEHKCSLFVNNAIVNNKNYFSVLDYEVYTHYERRKELQNINGNNILNMIYEFNEL